MRKIVPALLLIVLVACSPLVPYDQMPRHDLYESANSYDATANAAMQIAQLQRQAMTATAQAPIIQITATAAAVSVQSTQAAGTSTAAVQTQQGALTATAVWWTPTPNLASTATVAVLNAQGTAIAHNVERDRLALERQQLNNEFWRLAGPIVLLAVLLFASMGAFTFIRRWSHMPAPVDERGNVIPILNVVDGLATDLDRNPNFQTLLKSGIVRRLIEAKLELPPLLPAVTEKRQDATTERDQMVDLATRGLPGQETRERKQLAAQAMANQQQAALPSLDSRFVLMDGGDLEGIIDGTIVTVLDQDWQKEVDSK